MKFMCPTTNTILDDDEVTVVDDHFRCPAPGCHGTHEVEESVAYEGDEADPGSPEEG